MLLGQQIGSYHPSKYGNHFDTTLAAALASEEAGLDSVWLPDHFMFPDRENPEREVPVFDCMVALGAIAARTHRIRIGQLVIGMPYRNPALLAKMCATLDVISHGRSIIGLGAAWHEPEFVAYDWPFPSVSERMRMLEEGVQVIDRMLTQRPASFSGRVYNVHEAYNDPMPVQKPRPPIMIGGGGEKKTLKLVAQYADFCNVGGNVETVRSKFDILRRHCETVGRDPNEIIFCANVGILLARDGSELESKRKRFPDFRGMSGTSDEVLTQLKGYVDVGAQYLTFKMPDAEDIDPIYLLGETVVSEASRL